MKMTPIDLLNRKFGFKVRGYDPSEVSAFLNDAASAFEDLLAENARLIDRLRQLEEELSRFKEIESTLNNALILAQKTSDEMKANAEKEADLIVREAEEKMQRELGALRSDLERLREDRDRFMIEFRSLLRSYLEICEDRFGGGATEHPAGE